MTDSARVDCPSAGSSARSRIGIGTGVVGIVLQSTVIAYFYWPTAIMITPWYAQILVLAVWAGLLVLGIRWLRSPRPARALAIPFLAAGAWFAILILGTKFLGFEA